MTVRVLLVEDETLVRQGIRGLLELEARIEIAAEAADGEEALGRIAEARRTWSCWTCACPGSTASACSAP